MTKKIFLGFTMMMVLIAGTLIYGRVAEAKNYQKEKTRRIEAKLPVGEEVIFTYTAPLRMPHYGTELLLTAGRLPNNREH